MSDAAVRRLAWVAAVAAPALLLAVLLAVPDADERWENQPAHFWLVLAAALASVALGSLVGGAARRRRDARLFLVSLAFVAAAGFLGLHALATPGVLLGRNAGFELATPVGLLVAAVFAAASVADPSPAYADAVVRNAGRLLAALVALFATWGVFSLAELPPLGGPLGAEALDGWQVTLAVAGGLLYAAAALGYLRLYRRRRVRFVLVVTLAFALLAEAMVTIAWARNWQLSWWEWHVLMLVAFLAIALAARLEWHEERWSALYLDETLAGAQDVSILFADLAGFTAFSERTTPEEAAAMLNAYFARIIPLMASEGGEVHQLAGDQLMVIFNKHGESPDHGPRAARAALDLQRVAAEVARPGWPRFRVGVNTGEVHAGVVGAGGRSGHRKHGVVGDTVNLAARLESSAPVDGVVVGAETFRRLPPGALVERLADLRVKGKSEPVEAYVLRGLPGEDAAPTGRR
ncbi:MAG TPA: adenylate/guanylate cyclase domain-containing protein [Gaiellaceae bacterium]|nr:adenylate/guanylate cyclase domain-containing protein [Gaiellaceae bacterium]